LRELDDERVMGVKPLRGAPFPNGRDGGLIHASAEGLGSVDRPDIVQT
jgi:hypothetical protein